MPDQSHATRSEVLTPSPAYRVVFPAVAVFFCAGLGYNLLWWVRGELEWDLTHKIGLPLLALIALASLVGGLASLTNRVWVDYAELALHERSVFRETVVRLDAPTTARLTYKPPAPGSTVLGTWKVVLERPGSSRHTVQTPWVRSIGDALRVLQPALERNPDLPADEYTRAALADPSNLSAPPV
jgi:hypothetical protein